MFLILLQQTGFDLEAEFQDAYRRAGVKHEVVARLMGMKSHHQLSQQLAKRGHLSYRRVLLLALDPDGLRVLRILQARINDYLGMTEHGSLAQQLKGFMEQLPKLIDKLQISPMVKAEIREREAAKEIA